MTLGNRWVEISGARRGIEQFDTKQNLDHCGLLPGRLADDSLVGAKLEVGTLFQNAG
jgi:hypothetical protein